MELADLPDAGAERAAVEIEIAELDDTCRSTRIAADAYPPSDIKPAWPIENCPVNPFTTVSDVARMIAMPELISRSPAKPPTARRDDEIEEGGDRSR